MKTTATITGLLCAVAAWWLAFTTYTAVSMAGFPDGYLTDYGNAVDGPLRIVMWVAVSFGIVFVALTFSPMSTRTRIVGLVVALIGFVAMALLVKVGVPWYYGTHLGLDNGVGG
jgi:hypothetical protein